MEKGINIGQSLDGDCKECGRLACICPDKERHHEHCWFLAAVSCPVAIECPHGYDVCPRCDPCTCRMEFKLTRLQTKLLYFIWQRWAKCEHFSTIRDLQAIEDIHSRSKIYREVRKLRAHHLVVAHRTAQYGITTAGIGEAVRMHDIAREVLAPNDGGTVIDSFIVNL